MTEYGLPAERILYSRGTSFKSGILKATNGRGVDVILNSLTGDAMRASWECLDKFGRFIDIGKRDQGNKTRVELSHFDNNATLLSVDLLVVAAERPAVIKRIVADVAGLISNGTARKTTPINTFAISDVEAAFKSLQLGNEGKTVVSVNSGDTVMVSHLPTTRRFASLFLFPHLFPQS